MGANKRQFNKKSILKIWKKKGYEGLKSMIGKTEIFMYKDDFSMKVVTAFFEKDSSKIEYLCSLNR